MMRVMTAPQQRAFNQQRRRLRRPSHRFSIRQRPWAITPFLLAPVIPGETLRNALWQARVVSKPIKDPLTGWWIEYYLYYVKLRDMEPRELLKEMILNQDADLSSLEADGDQLHHFAFDGGVDWVKLCLDRVVDEYFRNEGEAVDDFMVGDYPACSVGVQNWMDSLTPAEYMEAIDVEVAASDVPVMASEVERAMMEYEYLRQHNLTEMTYEDFLAAYGVRIANIREHRPELLRFVRDWSYPSNTIDPTTGDPASAMSWSVSERADKDRFFAEPGFIFGVTVARPKVYLMSQTGSASGLLSHPWAWMPAALTNDPRSSLALVPQGQGPLPELNDPDGYWVDLRDLYLYGEDFRNHAEVDAGVQLPLETAQRRYADGAMADALFVSSETNWIAQDGILNMTIASRQEDTSPQTALYTAPTPP